MTFSNFYAHYPRHIARRAAEKAWGQLMKKGIEPEMIFAILEKRKQEDWRGRDKKHIPYPATFLRAEDFDDEVEARDDGLPVMHLCPVCIPAHEHRCTNPEHCTAGRELACDRVLARYRH